MNPQEKAAQQERMRWFAHDRFGMFIHWGIYSVPARGEWVRSKEHMPLEDYQLYFDEFNPVDYDPRAWARAAKEAGMKYAVLTAKHHDGFCLFDSKLTEFTAMHTPFKRDIVREFLDAFRAEGLRVGLYYSLLDWHHPDYPHFGDEFHPMRENEAYKDAAHTFDTYLDYMHAQVRELCTGYGKLDIMWFDFSYGKMVGEMWRGTELVNMVRSFHPDILIDNRLEVGGVGFGSLLTAEPNVYSGDFCSPEQIIPPKGIFRDDGQRAVWEACVTMNGNWGYAERDTNYKPAPLLIKKLVECVSKGGNLLLNVGPDARGCIPAPSLGILSEIGAWMAKNGQSIYGAGHADLDKPDTGRITRKGKTIYYHVMENCIGPIPLYGIAREDIASVRLLATGAEIKLSDHWASWNYPELAFISLGDRPTLPDTTDTVVQINLK